MTDDIIFQPLRFRNLTIPNRILRSNIAGKFDGYDGSGSQTRINWELKFARNGVGAIVSSWVGVDLRGRIVPGYASIYRDDQIPFWRELGKQVHEYDCKYILQLAHAGRQRDVPGFEIAKALTSTRKQDPLHGFPSEQMTVDDIKQVTRSFAAAARRVREAGLDGIEIHGANGYLFTQFLSSAINDRKDDYGGSLENRARLLLEVVRAIRSEVGDDFHLQVKISAVEHANASLPWDKKGNTIEDSKQVCQWLEKAGVDAIHVSTGSTFPHPYNPAGQFHLREAADSYSYLLTSGKHTLRNYLGMRTFPVNQFFKWRWNRPGRKQTEGALLPDAAAIKSVVSIPVLCTGGFQSASMIRNAITTGKCDAVTIGRPLVANNDLVEQFRAGRDRPALPCTFCNRCLNNVLQHPLGCYDESRYPNRQAMIDEIMSVYGSPEPGNNWPNPGSR
ncbi:MAG: NADH:flavin oxidoreductase [Thermomicrobiales bacterium]|nr:NADH:flavin oxidoreductase [Thermomicrobiales bacterium]